MKNRVGNFSSSEIHKLMSKGRGKFTLNNTGKPFDTYIKEKKREIILGRSVSKESNSRPLVWGRFLEFICYNDSTKFDMNYQRVSDKHTSHKTISNWVGATDFINNVKKTIGEHKSPFTINSFMDKLEAAEEGIESIKENIPEDYWQMVSNSILENVDLVEWTFFCPYKSDLKLIRELANDPLFCAKAKVPQDALKFIDYLDDEELPYLLDDGNISSFQRFKFEVPTEDKELLTERVKLAVSKL